MNNYVQGSIDAITSVFDAPLTIRKMASGIYTSQLAGNKLLVGGVGGSCATAEHFAGEMTCTFNKPIRRGFSAISLTNNSAVTAWANDFVFESYFKRQVEAHGKPGDILFLISCGGGCIETGTSMSLVYAAEKAKELDMKVYSIIGKSGGELIDMSDEWILVDSFVGSHIQEAHLVIIHMISKLLDDFISKSAN